MDLLVQAVADSATPLLTLFDEEIGTVDVVKQHHNNKNTQLGKQELNLCTFYSPHWWKLQLNCYERMG